MHYLIKTYGCQMNIHESEKIAGILEKLGYSETQEEKQADVIVFNTCCIRETAEAKINGHIGEIKKIQGKKSGPHCRCLRLYESTKRRGRKLEKTLSVY